MPRVLCLLALLLCLSLAALPAAAQPAAAPPPAAKAKVEVAADDDAGLATYAARLSELFARFANPAMATVADSGETRVRFRVRRDGLADTPGLALSSGKPALDQIALTAVADALAQAEPLPAAIDRSSAGFQARFLFNIVEAPRQESVSLADLARRRSRPADSGEKKVYTNEDVAGSGAEAYGSSRTRDPIRESSKRTERKSNSSSAKESSSGATNLPQEKDPQYYRDRLDPLQAELKEVDRELARLRNVPHDYRTGLQAERTAGASTISNSVQNDIERYQRRRAELERRIAAIREEAARNDIYLPY